MEMAPGDRAFVSKVSFPVEQSNRVPLAEVAMRRVCSLLYIICMQTLSILLDRDISLAD